MTRIARDSIRPPAAPADALRPPRLELIERSHQRSAALGLTRGDRRDFDPMVRSDLAVARERHRRLFVHAAPVMQMLFEQIVDSDSMIVLTDAQGTILHSVGDDEFLRRADKVALAPGENWAEHSKGTNAIGTALFEGAPTLVHGHEHFIHAHHFLTCSAAPIFDPRGNVLGVLDVTGDHRGYHRHTMGLVRMSARMIENHWLSDDRDHALRLHFHARSEFIGTLLEGIVVVGLDGRILGGSRGALDQLGLSDAALRTHSVASLFGTTPAAIHDHGRSPLSVPMRLALPDGRPVHAIARVDGPSRPVFAATGVPETPRADAEGPIGAHATPSDTVPAGPSPAPPAARAAGRRGAVRRFSGLDLLRTGDPQVEAVVQKARRVLDRDIPLLLLGETGTGKELLARAVHHDSARARQPFVVVDCAAMPASAVEAELFGREDGTPGGARRRGAPGRIVQAHGGTLFLDEIGALPKPLQARLLRVLQERCVSPPGSVRAVPVDTAVIAATRRDLRAIVDRHDFRDDLYYRLNGLSLRLPALRERNDLAALARRILQAERPHDPPVLGPRVLELFLRHRWPGNVRQLANALRSAAAMSAGEREITLAHLPDDLLDDAPRAGEVPPASPPPTLEQAEIAMIRDVLDAEGGNVSAASKRLGIGRNTIYRKLRRNVAERPA